MSDEHPPAYFESLFATDTDPWRFRSRWYEARKRALTLAALPHRRYARAYEPGCANGELSAALAERCDELLVSDGVDAAVQLARDRLAGFRHVQVLKGWVPESWPEGHFDLIVFSEFGYYLSNEAFTGFCDKVREALAPQGVVLACHWRRLIEGCQFDGMEVHRRLASQLRLPLLGRWLDDDFVLDLWSADTRSVAGQEGLA